MKCSQACGKMEQMPGTHSPPFFGSPGLLSYFWRCCDFGIRIYGEDQYRVILGVLLLIIPSLDFTFLGNSLLKI